MGPYSPYIDHSMQTPPWDYCSVLPMLLLHVTDAVVVVAEGRPPARIK